MLSVYCLYQMNRGRANYFLQDAGLDLGMIDLGKFLIVAGVILALAGVALMVVGRMGVPLGKLPGDLIWRGKNTTVYFPLATSIVLSVALTLVLWVLGRWGK